MFDDEYTNDDIPAMGQNVYALPNISADALTLSQNGDNNNNVKPEIADSHKQWCTAHLYLRQQISNTNSDI